MNVFSLKSSLIITGFLLEAQGILLNSPSRSLLSNLPQPPHPAHPSALWKHIDPLLSYCIYLPASQTCLLIQGRVGPAWSIVFSLQHPWRLQYLWRWLIQHSSLSFLSPTCLFFHAISATHSQNHILDFDMINNSTLSRISISKSTPLSNYIFPSLQLVPSIILSPAKPTNDLLSITCFVSLLPSLPIPTAPVLYTFSGEALQGLAAQAQSQTAKVKSWLCHLYAMCPWTS